MQTGLGRTGRFLALEHWGIQPDLVPLSKSLSGGYVPLGALLCSRAVFDATFDSMERSVVRGSTFGNGEFAAVRARQSYDDLLSQDTIPGWLGGADRARGAA